ncbi:hypothetical protein, partial [Bartonella sp. CL74QHWL]|uniref:hypothetical protein n=1 Tax=Bartonella sp. CL74QHWL TaxID=3243541 RepID=UPI0035CFA1B4
NNTSGSAVFVGYLSRANLSNTGIKNFTVGLESVRGGDITVKDGYITNVRYGVTSFSPESYVSLDGTVLNVIDGGVRSSGSGVMLKGVGLVAKEGAIGIEAEKRGAVVVKSSKILISP